MVEVLIVEMFGSDRSRPTDYQRAVVVDGRGAKETRKTTLRSEWRSALKKSLTEPALLEMSGNDLSGADATYVRSTTNRSNFLFSFEVPH
jgi:hypothetical protein